MNAGLECVSGSILWWCMSIDLESPYNQNAIREVLKLYCSMKNKPWGFHRLLMRINDVLPETYRKFDYEKEKNALIIPYDSFRKFLKGATILDTHMIPLVEYIKTEPELRDYEAFLDDVHLSKMLGNSWISYINRSIRSAPILRFNTKDTAEIERKLFVANNQDNDLIFLYIENIVGTSFYRFTLLCSPLIAELSKLYRQPGMLFHSLREAFDQQERIGHDAYDIRAEKHAYHYIRKNISKIIDNKKYLNLKGYMVPSMYRLKPETNADDRNVISHYKGYTGFIYSREGYSAPIYLSWNQNRMLLCYATVYNSDTAFNRIDYFECFSKLYDDDRKAFTLLNEVKDKQILKEFKFFSFNIS